MTFYSIFFSESLVRYRRLTKEVLWVFLGQIGSVFGALLLIKVLTAYLNKTEYGELALVLTFAGLVNQLVMGGIAGGIGRFYSVASETNTLPAYAAEVMQLMISALVVVIIIGVVLILGLLYSGFSRWIGLAALVLFFSIVGGVSSVLNSTLGAARQRAIIGVNTLFDAFLKIIFVFCMFSALGSSSTAVITAYILSTIIIIVSQYCSVRRLIPGSWTIGGNERLLRSDILAYSWPFMTWGLFGWAQQSAPRWALGQLASTADVGCFTVLSQLGYAPMQTVIGFIMTLITPILFARVGDATCFVRKKDTNDLIFKFACIGIGLSGIMLLLAVVFHSIIFHLFVSERYWSISHYLPWFVLAGGIFIVAQIYATRMLAFMAPHRLIPSAIGSSIIGVLSAYIGVYYYSLQGAVASLVIHASSYLLLVLITKHNSTEKATS